MKIDAKIYCKKIPFKAMEVGDLFWFGEHVSMKINEIEFRDEFEDFYCYNAIDLETALVLEVDSNSEYELINNVKLVRE